MRKSNLILLACLLAQAVLGQKPFANCAAAFLNGKMIVQEYTDAAKAKISIQAKGELTASTAELGTNYAKQVKKFAFGIAIKDKNTGTKILFSTKTFMKIAIEDILKKCKKGDSIILLTLDDEYALPHNEILVQ
jgi:hypothetical protein